MSTQLITTTVVQPATITIGPQINNQQFQGWYIKANGASEPINCPSGQSLLTTASYAECCDIGATTCSTFWTRCVGNTAVGLSSNPCGSTSSCLTMSIFNQFPAGNVSPKSQIICAANWQAFSVYRTIVTTTPSTATSVITSVIPISSTPGPVSTTPDPSTPSPTTNSPTSASSAESSVTSRSVANTAQSSDGSSDSITSVLSSASSRGSSTFSTAISSSIDGSAQGAVNGTQGGGSTNSNGSSSGGSQAWIAGAVIGPLAALAIAFLFFWLYRRRKRSQADEKGVSPVSAPPTYSHVQGDDPDGNVEYYGKGAAAATSPQPHEMSSHGAAHGANEYYAKSAAVAPQPYEIGTHQAADTAHEMPVALPSTGPFELSNHDHRPRANLLD